MKLKTKRVAIKAARAHGTWPVVRATVRPQIRVASLHGYELRVNMMGFPKSMLADGYFWVLGEISSELWLVAIYQDRLAYMFSGSTFRVLDD